MGKIKVQHDQRATVYFNTADKVLATGALNILLKQGYKKASAGSGKEHGYDNFVTMAKVPPAEFYSG